MESAHTVKPADGSLPSVVSTASCAYLWDDSCIATNVGIVGSEGYYIYLYKNCLIIRGRSFDRGEWIGSAQFILPLPTSGGTETESATETATEPVTEPVTGTEPDSSTQPVPGTATGTVAGTSGAGADSSTLQEPTTTAADSSASGCASSLGGALGSISVLLLGGAVLSRRKRSRNLR